jgi:hypothetical protein
MNLFQNMSILDWGQLAALIVGSVISVIALIWGLGKSRMAEQIMRQDSAKLKFLELETAVGRRVESAQEANRADHLSILGQIPSIAEHKASVAVAPAIAMMTRIESQQETARREHREDIGRIFTEIDQVKMLIRETKAQ